MAGDLCGGRSGVIGTDAPRACVAFVPRQQIVMVSPTRHRLEPEVSREGGLTRMGLTFAGAHEAAPAMFLVMCHLAAWAFMSSTVGSFFMPTMGV
jgi:hypothetical protein